MKLYLVYSGRDSDTLVQAVVANNETAAIDIARQHTPDSYTVHEAFEARDGVAYVRTWKNY